MHSFGLNSRPEHLQLYFYDDDPSLVHRKEATKDLDQEVMRKVVDILKGNPYSEKFRSLGAHKDNLQDYRIELNTDKKLDNGDTIYRCRPRWLRSGSREATWQIDSSAALPYTEITTRGIVYRPPKDAMTRSRTPSSSPRGSSVGIQISLNVIRLGTLRNYQERTAGTKVRLFKIVLHFLSILFVLHLTFF
jgi:hypothetical protein